MNRQSLFNSYMAQQDSSICDSAYHPINQSGNLWHSVGSPLSRDIYKDTEQHHHPYGLPYEWNLPCEPAIGSPAESCKGSNETESEDDDDYTAGLAERIAHSMLDDDDTREVNVNKGWGCEQKRSWAAVAGKVLSPQSTLPGLGSWSICSAASSTASSGVSSPLSTFLDCEEDTWDSLSLATRKGVKMNAAEEIQAYEECFPPLGGRPTVSTKQQLQLPLSQNQVLVSPNTNSSNASVSKPTQAKLRRFHTFGNDTDPKATHHLCRTLSAKTGVEEQGIRGWQPGAPKHGSVASWVHQDRSIQEGMASTRSEQCPGWDKPYAPCPVTQPTGAGSGLRAVFLRGDVSNRESIGTGVFFPRPLGSSDASYHKKRPTFTVLLPSRIVEVLKLNIEDAPCPLLRPRNVTHCSDPRDAAAAAPPVGGCSSTPYVRIDLSEGHEVGKVKCSNCSSLHSQIATDISLPSEWTY
eukprot:c23907_g1_i3 orf=381-1778(-)